MSFEFDKYSDISDKGVNSLCKNLDRLKSLKGVWIKFSDCVTVTAKGCQKAAQLLGSHRQIMVYECRVCMKG